jgi:hypothetical protein
MGCGPNCTCPASMPLMVWWWPEQDPNLLPTAHVKVYTRARAKRIVTLGRHLQYMLSSWWAILGVGHCSRTYCTGDGKQENHCMLLYSGHGELLCHQDTTHLVLCSSSCAAGISKTMVSTTPARTPHTLWVLLSLLLCTLSTRVSITGSSCCTHGMLPLSCCRCSGHRVSTPPARTPHSLCWSVFCCSVCSKPAKHMHC